jgi:hypothetical protein
LLLATGKQPFSLDENVGQGTTHFDDDAAMDRVSTAAAAFG